jgi:hypothetical protein
MGTGERSGASRYARVIASVLVTLTLVGCGGLTLLPYQTDINNSNFKSYQDVEVAYRTITPGTTHASDLDEMGFDATRSPNVEVLSYLGVIERFMPRDSMRFDTLAPPVQSCIEAREGCTAYVFRPEHIEKVRTGNFFLDVFGFQRTTMKTGWSAEVIILVQDGRVAYKVMSGKPRIEDFEDKIQPLGPFQDIGGAVIRTASRAAGF